MNPHLTRAARLVIDGLLIFLAVYGMVQIFSAMASSPLSFSR